MTPAIAARIRKCDALAGSSIPGEAAAAKAMAARLREKYGAPASATRPKPKISGREGFVYVDEFTFNDEFSFEDELAFKGVSQETLDAIAEKLLEHVGRSMFNVAGVRR